MGAGSGSGSVLNEAAVTLSEILLNNSNTGGMVLDGILRAAIGMNLTQLMTVRSIGTEG